VIIRTSETVSEPSLPELDGSWERAHRNITAAAFFGLLITGVVYFHAQAVLSLILISLTKFVEHTKIDGTNFIDRMMQLAAVMKNPIRYSLIISQFLFMLVPTIWIIKSWHTKQILSYVRFKRIPILELLLAVAATICFVPLSSGISEYFVKQLHIPDFLSNIDSQIFTSYSRMELLWLVVVVCITPALCEEMLFRGYVQRTLERTLGIKSLFITGTIFGLYHMQPINLISLSLLGILIGYFSYRSKNILPAMAAHFTNNFFVILSLYKMPDGEPIIEIFTLDTTFLFIIVSLVFGGILLYVYHIATQRNFVVN
jgi:uncharacterized protein